ncbi:NUDIX hydrolase [Rarobacter incanus]|uniref:ADP-ribose pyrophosphatase YjhB (NUDIX family) n=1 Tax=Rarobacter incanus TaxID=153494 RepID=A0A542SPP4_9MICO|nr:NUDIX domain-containing protein [Rarobacter incanus]TQK76562.1 ADP-ribose pyrophosphatase YjhB (NUDIX family) [Rarobacter incanus]
MAESRIVVAAVCFVDDDGRVLTVRRSGTEPFILPGGKLRSDEGLASAALRAVDECLGITLQLVDLAWLGTWTALAANHPDHNVIATVFTAILPQEPVPGAGIEEIHWVDPNGIESGIKLAPLLEQFVLKSVA